MSETKEQIEVQIAELQAKLEELNTGGFKVGDKVVIEGVVSEIEDSYSHPLKVKMSGGKYDYFRPYDLRHAEAEQEPVGYVNIYKNGNGGNLCDTAECAKGLALPGKVKEVAVPLYRTPTDASKRIAELEKQCEKIKAEAKRWKKQSEMWEKRAKKSHKKWTQLYADNQDMRDMLRGKNERIKELERGLAEWSKFEREYPASPEESFVGAAVAPKGVKEDIKKANRECEHTRAEAALIAHNYKSTTQEQVKAQELWVNASRKLDAAIDQIVELPEPSEYVWIKPRPTNELNHDQGFDVYAETPDWRWFYVNSKENAMRLAAALIKAAQEVES